MKHAIPILQLVAMYCVQTVAVALPQVKIPAPAKIADWVPQIAAPGTNWLAFSKDSRFVIGGGGDMIRVWNSRNGALERQVPADSASIQDVGVARWNSNGVAPLLAEQWPAEIARRDALLRQYMRVVPQSALPDFGSTNCFQFSPDGRILAAGGDNGLMRLWDVNTGRVLKTLPAYFFPREGRNSTDLYINALAFSPDERYVAASSGLGTQVWSLPSGLPMAKIPNDLERIRFSPDGRYLAGSGYFGGNTGVSLMIFRTRGGRLVRQLDCEQGDGSVRDFAFSPDGRRLTTVGHWSVSMNEPRQLWHMWDWRRGRKIWKTTQVKGDFTAVAFSPDGRSVVTSDGTGIMLRDARRGRLLWSALGGGYGPGVSDGYPSLFSPRGSLMRTSEAVWQLRGSVRVFQQNLSLFTRDGRWQARLIEQDMRRFVVERLQVRAFGSSNAWRTLQGSPPLRDNESAHGPAFSRDGRYIACCFPAEFAETGNVPQGKIDVWELPSGKLCATFRGELAPITSLVFTPDGESLIINDGYSLRRWDWARKSADAVRWRHNEFFFSAMTNNGTLTVLRLKVPDSKKMLDSKNLVVSSLDAETGTERGKPLVFARSRPNDYNDPGVVLSADGEWLARPRWENHWFRGGRPTGPFRWELWQVAERRRVRDLPGGSFSGFAPSVGEPRFYAATEGNLLTLRKVRTGALILSLFARYNNELLPNGSETHNPSPTWFAFTPDGYYDGSPGGILLLHRRVQGQLQPASNFRAGHRPDVLRRRIEELLPPLNPR